MTRGIWVGLAWVKSRMGAGFGKFLAGAGRGMAVYISRCGDACLSRMKLHESGLCMGWEGTLELCSRAPLRICRVALSGLGAGGSPAATHFSCFAKKSNQKKATRGSSPRKSAGFLALLEPTGRCGTRARRWADTNGLVCARHSNSPRGMPLSLLRYSATLIGTRSYFHGWCSKRACVNPELKDLHSCLCNNACAICGRRNATGAPMRGAEQRSKRGGCPRGLSEGEHKRNLLSATFTSPSSAAARVCEQRREPRQSYRRGDEPGVAFLWLLSLAKQRK